MIEQVAKIELDRLQKADEKKCSDCGRTVFLTEFGAECGYRCYYCRFVFCGNCADKHFKVEPKKERIDRMINKIKEAN